MKLTDEQIQKFQILYENRFGEKLDRGEAYEQGIKLVRLMQLIYKPMTKDEYQNLLQRRKTTTP